MKTFFAITAIFITIPAIARADEPRTQQFQFAISPTDHEPPALIAGVSLGIYGPEFMRIPYPEQGRQSDQLNSEQDPRAVILNAYTLAKKQDKRAFEKLFVSAKPESRDIAFENWTTRVSDMTGLRFRFMLAYGSSRIIGLDEMRPKGQSFSEWAMTSDGTDYKMLVDTSGGLQAAELVADVFGDKYRTGKESIDAGSDYTSTTLSAAYSAVDGPSTRPSTSEGSGKAVPSEMRFFANFKAPVREAKMQIEQLLDSISRSSDSDASKLFDLPSQEEAKEAIQSADGHAELEQVRRLLRGSTFQTRLVYTISFRFGTYVVVDAGRKVRLRDGTETLLPVLIRLASGQPLKLSQFNSPNLEDQLCDALLVSDQCVFPHPSKVFLALIQKHHR